MKKWQNRKTWKSAHQHAQERIRKLRDIPVTIEERPDAGKYGRWRVMQNGQPIAATLTLDGALAWIHNHDYKLLTLEDFDEPPAATGHARTGWTCRECNTINDVYAWECRNCGYPGNLPF